MTGSLRPGDELVVAGWVGLDGSAVLARERADYLKSFLPEGMILRAVHFFESESAGSEEELAKEADVSAVTDMCDGGIFGALWDMGAASGVGFEADLDKIPIRQETIEICEIFDINPYMLRSCGSMLIGSSCGSRLVSRLEEAGIHAVVIGYVNGGADRVVRNKDARRFLEPRHPDELFRALEVTL